MTKTQELAVCLIGTPLVAFGNLAGWGFSFTLPHIAMAMCLSGAAVGLAVMGARYV